MTAETLEQPITQTQPEPAPTPAPAKTPKPWPAEATISAWLVVAAGAAFRLRYFFHWRSLWLDELYLAHSIVTRGFIKLLFQPLDFWQGAPPGFLVMERLCNDLFGSGERVLRLPSLLAGLASLPLFFILVRKLLSLRATLLAITLFSVLTPLIHFSAEVKPYSLDVTACLAILLTAVSVWQEPQSGRNLLIFFAVGAVSLFFSYPAAFVLGGCGVVALTARIFGGGERGLATLIALLCVAVWVGLQWVNVHFFLRPLMYGPTHQGLVQYWMEAGGFPPWQPNMAAHWVWTAFDEIFKGMYLSAPELGIYAAILGLLGLLAAKPRVTGLMILMPLLLALAAAFRRQYPLADRLALYLIPLLVILIAQGIHLIWGADSIGRSAAGGLAAIMLICGPVAQSAYEFRWPTGREETKELYQWLQRNWRPGDLVVISHMGQLSFDYYAPRAGLSGLQQLWLSPTQPDDTSQLLESSVQGAQSEPWFIRAFTPPELRANSVSGYVVLQPDRSAEPGRYLDDVDHILHPDPDWHWPKLTRVWFVFVHVNEESPRVDHLCLAEMDRLAQHGVRHQEDGAAVYFYDVNGPPSAFQKN